MSASELAHLVKTLKEEREWLLKVVKRAYQKHHLDEENIGWDELGIELHNALCNVMGDDGYIAWRESLE